MDTERRPVGKAKLWAYPAVAGVSGGVEGGRLLGRPVLEAVEESAAGGFPRGNT
jgi:hypothetical protein